MSSSIVRLNETPQALTFANRACDAEQVPSNFGDKTEFLHYLRPGGFLYLPEKAHKLLCRLDAPAGSVVQCWRTQRGRSYDYQFSILESDNDHRAHETRKRTPFADPDDYGTSQPTETPWHQSPQPPRQAQAMRQQETSPQRVTQGANALAPQAQPPARPAPTPIAPPKPAHEQPDQLLINAAANCMDVQRPEAKKMCSALFNAIDALRVAEQYARSRGMEIRFTADDVRAFSISAYIELNKREGRA